MEITKDVICPYCGLDLEWSFDSAENHLGEVLVCLDKDDGGCEKRFVITWQASIEVTATKLKGE